MRSSYIWVIVEGYDVVRASLVPCETIDVPGGPGPLHIPGGIQVWVGDVSLHIADPAKAREIATAILAALPATDSAVDLGASAR